MKAKINEDRPPKDFGDFGLAIPDLNHRGRP